MNKIPHIFADRTNTAVLTGTRLLNKLWAFENVQGSTFFSDAILGSLVDFPRVAKTA